MRCVLLTSFLALALLISAGSLYAPTTHAQSGVLAPPATPPTAPTVWGAIGEKQTNPTQEGTDKPTSYAVTGMNKAMGSIMMFIMSIFAWLLGLAMVLLDNSVYYTVVTMGTYVKDLSAIGVVWHTLRDIGNILLIFGFLAVGITVILNVDWYGGGKKFLPMLLIAAVFLNFSLFISMAIIDTGNLFATQFYTQINGGIPAGSASLSNEVISSKLMNQLGLQTLYGAARTNSTLFQDTNPTFIGVLGILLFIVAAFVMLSLAFILITRFVILIFLMVLSPIGFAGLAIPQLKSTADKWWSALFEQTITAPILLLLLYIALRVITDPGFMAFGPPPNYLGFITSSGPPNLAGLASALLSFIVAMGLLLAVVYFSKKLGAIGGSWATKTAGKLTFGATAWAGRSSVGWIANKSAHGLRGTALGRVPLVGTGLVKGLDRVSTGNFDVRGTGALKNFPGGGIDAGIAQKGGYKADFKSRVESRTKYAKDLKGRELTGEEKGKQAVLMVDIQKAEKELKDLRINAAHNPDDHALKTRVKQSEDDIKKKQNDLEAIEAPTDKGAQRTYAKALNLGLNEKSFFNKYINLAANTGAGKKIRDEVKKSKTEKTLEAFKKAVEDSEKEKNPEPEKEKKEEAK